MFVDRDCKQLLMNKVNFNMEHLLHNFDQGFAHGISNENLMRWACIDQAYTSK